MKRITRKRTSKNQDFIKLRKKAQLQRLSIAHEDECNSLDKNELQSDLHISSQVTVSVFVHALLIYPHRLIPILLMI